LIVSATDSLVAQELLLRQAELLAAFGDMADGAHLLKGLGGP